MGDIKFAIYRISCSSLKVGERFGSGGEVPGEAMYENRVHERIERCVTYLVKVN